MAKTTRENRPIIALDLPDKVAVNQFLAKFPRDEKLFIKIGMEIFYQEGPSIVRLIKELGHCVFLDLKLHDIPNTVRSAMRSLANLGVEIVSVHATGGSQMMKSALLGLQEGVPSSALTPKLIAVTQLTSTSEEAMQKEQLIAASLEKTVINYAKLAQKSGLAGVVCSAWEVSKIKEVTADDFICVTPGIRLLNAETSDQKRVVTPEVARVVGSDYIVVGRPITQADDPLEAYLKIKNHWSK